MTAAFNNLVEILHWREQKQSDKVAFEFITGDQQDGDLLTYGELSTLAKRVSTGLYQLMHTENERILILLPPGLDLITAFFGVLYSKSVAVLAPPPTSEKGTSFFYEIVNDLAPAGAIITSSSYVNNVKQKLKTIAKDIQVLTIEELLLNDSTSWTMPEGLNKPIPNLIQYTSGSTNSPKGVVISNQNIIHNSMVIQQSFFHTSKSKGLIWLPPYHDMGLIGGVIQPVYAGFSTVLMSPRTFIQRPLRWLKLITIKRATTSGGPNFGYDLCLKKVEEADKATLDLSSWEVAFNGAETVNPNILRQFAKYFSSAKFKMKAFLPCYGLAESTLYVTGSLKLDPPNIIKADRGQLQQNTFAVAQEGNQNTVELVSSGIPFYGEEIKIVDPETHKEQRPRDIGEIWVHSLSVAMGYWGKEEAIDTTFKAELEPKDGIGYLRTGDLGFLYRNELYVTGRLKEMIIIRGVNYYPQDIELSVQECNPALADGKGAVFAHFTNSEERLVVVNEIKREYLKEVDPESIITEIRVVIFQRYQINPYAVLLTKPGEIPKTQNGKIQRSQCKEKFLNDELATISRWKELQEYIAISGDDKNNGEEPEKTKALLSFPLDAEDFNGLKVQLENWLKFAIAIEVDMTPDTLDTEMHFGLYGLDSVSAVSIIAALEERLNNFKIKDTILWDYPNIAAASTFLAEQYLQENQTLKL